MILVLEQDSSDVAVVGLYPTLERAVVLIGTQELERGCTLEEVVELEDAVRAAVEQEHGAPVIDLEIESPFLSVQLLFKSVELSE